MYGQSRYVHQLGYPLLITSTKLIEGGTLSAAHSLQQLGAKTPLEASNLHRFSAHKFRSIP